MHLRLLSDALGASNQGSSQAQELLYMGYHVLACLSQTSD